MDEPFGAVDPLVRERLQEELLRLQRELAKTVLFVTHDIDEAIRMGDLIAVLEVGGLLAQFGPPEEILANPASEFVAQFVGADRGLKRLSLVRVGQLRLREPATARVGEPAMSVRGKITRGAFPYVLVVDDHGRPIGCAGPEQLGGAGAVTAGRPRAGDAAADAGDHAARRALDAVDRTGGGGRRRRRAGPGHRGADDRRDRRLVPDGGGAVQRLEPARVCVSVRSSVQPGLRDA